MATVKKPASYPADSPYYLVTDALQFLGFLQTVFGAEELMVHKDEGGRVLHADGSVTDDCRPDDGHHMPVVPSGRAGPMRIVHTHGPDCGCGHDQGERAAGGSEERRDA